MATLLPIGVAGAQSLQSILAQALVNDPQVLEARAREQEALSAMKATRAGHYPVLSVVGNQMLMQKSNDGTDIDKRFNPGLKGSLNLISWGGISAAVDRDREKQRYYQHKYGETREELGNTIGQLYLTALRAKDSLRVMQQNLDRHNKIIHDLEIIVKYDAGRRSELTQAKSRRLQVDANMAQMSRAMDLALSRLARYTMQPVRQNDLEAPFSRIAPETMISRFRNPDLASTPSYLAQAAELESVRANLRVSKASRLPSVNLEGQMTRDKKEVSVNLSWNIFDPKSRHTVAQNAQTIIAAESRLEQMLREVAEKSRTAEVDMRRSHERAQITEAQIAAQQQVVKAYELQFKIARRNLIDILDSYNELSGVELAHITAQNDYRDATLAYLRAQAQVAAWSGVADTRADPARSNADTRTQATADVMVASATTSADRDTGRSLMAIPPSSRVMRDDKQATARAAKLAGTPPDLAQAKTQPEMRMAAVDQAPSATMHKQPETAAAVIKATAAKTITTATTNTTAWSAGSGKTGAWSILMPTTTAKVAPTPSKKQPATVTAVVKPTLPVSTPISPATATTTQAAPTAAKKQPETIAIDTAAKATLPVLMPISSISTAKAAPAAAKKQPESVAATSAAKASTAKTVTTATTNTTAWSAGSGKTGAWSVLMPTTTAKVAPTPSKKPAATVVNAADKARPTAAKKQPETIATDTAAKATLPVLMPISSISTAKAAPAAAKKQPESVAATSAAKASTAKTTTTATTNTTAWSAGSGKTGAWSVLVPTTVAKVAPTPSKKPAATVVNAADKARPTAAKKQPETITASTTAKKQPETIATDAAAKATLPVLMPISSISTAKTAPVTVKAQPETLPTTVAKPGMAPMRAVVKNTASVKVARARTAPAAKYAGAYEVPVRPVVTFNSLMSTTATINRSQKTP